MREPVRPPAVSGRFYPSDPAVLQRDVDRLLQEAAAAEAAAREPAAEDSTKSTGAGRVDRPMAAIVPHAGYIYSGAVAARAYARLRGQAFKTVVLVGPDHYIGFGGVALYARGAFATPLGAVAIDEELAGALLSEGPPITEMPDGHAREHSLEVQLPFLKAILPDARIVPLLVGRHSRPNVEALGEALARHLPGRQALLVASTDLSHYHPRPEARDLDTRVIGAVRELDGAGLEALLAAGRGEACGGDAVAAVLQACGRLGADRAEILAYADSADVNQDTGAVVGYLAALVGRSDGASSLAARRGPGRAADPAGPAEQSGGGAPAHGPHWTGSLGDEDRRRLLDLARRSVYEAARGGTPSSDEDAPWPDRLSRPCGVFVTLKQRGHLRGCVGFLQPTHPLPEAITRAAWSAALQDSRFAPVTAEEVDGLSVEISLLTEPRAAQPGEVEVGRHGIIITGHGCRGLLLPQVAVEQGWDRERFLAETCRKAGLPGNAWRRGARIELFEATILR